MSGRLDRAVRVLDMLAAADVALPVRAMSEACGLSKSAVQRILADLVEVDLASQDPVTRHYLLGPKTLALGMAYQRRIDVRRVALPLMRALRDATQETVGVSVGLADQVLHVDQVESESSLRALFDIGRPLPLWSGAPARVLLAERSDEEIRRIVEEQAATDVVPANPPTPEVLVAAVARVRLVGFATAFEETLPGVSTMSVPVQGPAGALVAVLSLTAPSTRLPQGRMEELLPLVRTAADQISSGLGWMGPRAARAGDGPAADVRP